MKTWLPYLSALVLATIFILYTSVVLPSPEWVFLETVSRGEVFSTLSESIRQKYIFLTNEGRIQPFVGLPQNLALLFSQHPRESSIFITQGALAFIILIILWKLLGKFSTNSRVKLCIVVLFGISPSFVFSIYHPMLAETITLIPLGLLFYFSMLYLERGKLWALLFTVFLTITVTLAKVSGASISIVFFASLITHKLFFKSLDNRFLILGLTNLIIALTSFIYLLSKTGMPPDQPVNFFEFLKYYFVTDAILVAACLYMVIKILDDLRKKILDPKDAIINSLGCAGCIYFILLIAYGKHSEYQQVLSYLCLSVLLIRIFEWISTSRSENETWRSHLIVAILMVFSFNVTREFTPAVLTLITFAMIYLLVTLKAEGRSPKTWFIASVLSVFSIILLLHYKYRSTASFIPHFFLWLAFLSMAVGLSNSLLKKTNISRSQLGKAGAIFYIFSYILLPGIGSHVWHKLNAINLSKIETQIASISKQTPIRLLNNTTVQDCHTSLMYDFVLNARTNYGGINNLAYVKNPIYSDKQCMEAQESFSKIYAAVPQNFLYHHDLTPDLVLIKRQHPKKSIDENFEKHTTLNPANYEVIYYGDGAIIWKYFLIVMRTFSDYGFLGEPHLYLLRKIR